MRAQPQWQTQPAAVVTEDKPTGRISTVNTHARNAGVVPGLRYAAALAIVENLQAGTVSADQLDHELSRITEVLRDFSPTIEPVRNDPGLFWVGVRGLGRLYSGVRSWGQAVQAGLGKLAFSSVLIIGHSRFGTYSLARTRYPGKLVAEQHQQIFVFPSPEAELRMSRKIPLEGLSLPATVYQRLTKLGVQTVADFLALPLAGLVRRFGPEIEHPYRFAEAESTLPLQPEQLPPELGAHRVLPAAEIRRQSIVHHLLDLLQPLLKQLAARGQLLARLRLSLTLENGEVLDEQLAPATPTLNKKTLAELLQLRIDSLVLRDRVNEVGFNVTGVTAIQQQATLLSSTTRDLHSGARAFARIKADLGEKAVLKATLQSEHFPERSFVWEPLHHPVPALPGEGCSPALLVRRFYISPKLLPPLRLHAGGSGKKAQLIATRNFTVDSVPAFCTPLRIQYGPFNLSGGWWERFQHRTYYYVLDPHNRLWWIYQSSKVDRWYLQGLVE